MFFREKLCHKLGKYIFNKPHNIFLVYKRHLHIKLRKLAICSISPWIFVTETTGKLEVSLDSGNHKKLFVLLWRLRKSIKFPFLKSRWDQEIPRAFGSSFCENRCFYFYKAIFLEMVSYKRYD